MPFSRIVRRRKRFGTEIQAEAESAHCAFQIIETNEAASALAHHIETRGTGFLHLLLPPCIAPLSMKQLAFVMKKSAFALESTFLAPISEDAAAVILKEEDAIAFLRAEDMEDRRNILLRLSEAAPEMVDRVNLVDIRKSRSLFKFLVGPTEACHFNDTLAEDGIFHKSSSDVAKMGAEYRYFHVAPEEMKRFLMPIFHFWAKGGIGQYSIEHLSVPDVALQFIHGALKPADFNLLLDNFFVFLASRRKGSDNAAHTLAERAASYF